MKEQVVQNIIDLLKKLNYFELINEPNNFESFIQSLTVEQVKNLFATFNAKLREIPSSKKGTLDEDFMTVGTLVSTSNSVRDSILEKFLVAFKKIKSDKDRAALTYYILLNLHMFEDANGRTARLFYDLIMCDSNIQENADWYVHDENKINRIANTFEYYRGLEDVGDIGLLSSYQLLPEMEKEGLVLDERIEGKAIQIRMTSYGGVPIPEHIKSILTDYEIKNINFLLLDNDGEYTVGGLTMLLMAMKKGQLEEWIKANEESTRMVMEKYPNSRETASRGERFVFNISKQSQMFDSWTLEDYKDVINIGNHVKEKKLICTINMFVRLDQYIFENEKAQAIYV